MLPETPVGAMTTLTTTRKKSSAKQRPPQLFGGYLRKLYSSSMYMGSWIFCVLQGARLRLYRSKECAETDTHLRGEVWVQSIESWDGGGTLGKTYAHSFAMLLHNLLLSEDFDWVDIDVDEDGDEQDEEYHTGSVGDTPGKRKRQWITEIVLDFLNILKPLTQREELRSEFSTLYVFRWAKNALGAPARDVEVFISRGGAKVHSLKRSVRSYAKGELYYCLKP
ncbi:hypothetical protein PsorP6_000069 [Peronosclerospora sorghi]|uniref:Uncharacterized protein n=1 Tax=Peronosclerospora sorghi TaxID=230839 RepID=A0ACC0WRA5_9STRA|nr:hypothetical protein PsorP6_000069 [Peronosclerospora sorghi]